MLGLEGRLPMDGYVPAVTPVVILQDGTLPGTTLRRGARWICRLPPAGTPVNATKVAGLHDTEGVILEGILVVCDTVTAGGYQFSWEQFAPGSLTPAGVIADRTPGVNPVGTSISGLAGTSIGRLDVPQVAGVAHDPIHWPIECFLPPGWGIGIAHTDPANISGIAWGRLP